MANEPTKRRFTTFESLAVRDYRLLWLGQVSTSMGQWMDQVTRGWLIYSLTGSPFQLGLATAMRGFPLLIFGIAAGALADRSGRKAQLIIAQVVNAILNIGLAVLVVTGAVQPWHIYVTAFLAGTVQAFQQPARQTLISDIVGNERLLNALALNSAALNGSRVIGPSLSGVLIVALGIANSYFLQGFMYLIATVWTIQMRVPEPHQDRIQRQREPFFTAISEGFKFVAREANIRTLIMLALGPLTFAMAYTSLMPVIAIQVLHGNAGTQGILLSFIGVGALGGALVVASMKRTAGYGLPVVIGSLIFSGAVFAFASSSVLWVSCALGVVLGAFSVTYTTQNQTLLQVLAPRRIRGRVMSIYLLNRATVPMGALLAGALASAYGGQTAIHIMSAIAIAIIALVVATHPEFIRLRVGFSDAEEADRERVAAAEEARRGAGVAEAPASTERI